MNESNLNLIVFNDQFASKIIKSHQNKEQSIVFDYSPSQGRISKIEPLIRFRLITELSLIGHNINDITNICVLTNLKKLNLSWNRIESIGNLMKLNQLEILHLGHNQITTIPKSISNLSNLKSLQLSNNPISEKHNFFSMKDNFNLTCLDFESTPLSCDQDSLLFCIYVLPQLTIINRTQIEPEMRIESNNRFGREELDELSNINITLAQENKNYQKMINVMKDQLENPEKVMTEMKVLKSEKKQLIEHIKKQDQLIESLQKEASTMSESQTGTNPLSVVVKDLQEKLFQVQEQLSNKDKENKMLTYQIQEIAVTQETIDKLTSKNIQYKEKLGKLIKDNKELQSTNIKLYDQIGSMNDQNQNETLKEDYEQKLNELIEENQRLTNSLKETQNESAKLSQQYTNNLGNKNNQIQSLQEKLMQKDQIISELRQATNHLSNHVEIINNEDHLNKSESKSLFQSLLAEIEKQREFYSFQANKPFASTCSFEEQTYLLCSQTFKQIQVQFINLKQKIETAKDKKKTLKNAINDLHDEQKINENMIASLKANKEMLEREILDLKERIANSVHKSEYIQMKSEYDRVIAENEKNNITIKKAISQISEQKRVKNEILQHKTATEEENQELMARIEELSNEVKKKREKVEEYRFDSSKNERKILQLKEIINKMTLEKNQLNTQIKEFELFREEVTATIAKMEQQQSLNESKWREKIKSTENEKDKLVEKLNQLSSKITELNKTNNSMYDTQKEFDAKIKQKQRDLVEFESQNETLRLELKKLNEEFAKQKNEDHLESDSLRQQIESIQREKMELAATNQNELNQMQLKMNDTLLKEKRLIKKIQKFKEFIQLIQNENSNLNSTIDELKKKIEEMENLAKEANEREIRLKELVNTNDHLFKSLTKKNQDLQHSYEALTTKCDNYDHEKLQLNLVINQLHDKIKELQDEIVQTNEEKQNLDSQLLEKKQNINVVQAQLDEAKSKMNENDDNVLTLRQQNLDLQNQITECLIENDNLKKKVASLEKTTVPRETYQAAIEKSQDIGNKFSELSSLHDENLKTIEKLNDEKIKLAQSLMNLQKKNQDVLYQLKNTEELNEKNNQIQQKTIDSLKQQLSDARDLIEQKNSEEHLNTKQHENEVSELKTELMQSKTNVGIMKDNLQSKINENNRLKEENTNLKQNNEELLNKFNECYTNLSRIKQKLDDEQTHHEDDNNEKNQRIEMQKNKIQQLEKEQNSLQDQIKQLLIDNKSKVAKDKFNELQQKYNSLKKLHDFESSKTQASISQKDEKIDQLTTEFHDKEEKMTDEIDKLNHDLNDKKELIKRLQKQIQNDNKQIEQLTPLVGIQSEYDRTLKELKSKLALIDELETGLNEMKQKNDNDAEIINDNKITISKIASTMNQIPYIINGTGNNTNKLESIIKSINSILPLFRIDKIIASFQQKFKLQSSDLVTIKSSEETLLEKHKKILQKVAQALMSLPIGKPSFNIESNEQLESQLEKLQKLVQMVKTIFDEREKNIQNLSALVESQHQAVIKIAEVPTDSATVALSYQNYQKSQSILQEDKVRRSAMSNASLFPK